ncbi:MAG: insulinase family protein [Paludibacter sp.]|nr:insulinase family protein [Bacteroidales bacterium]MCM1069785.1 insulinase family protein [Prevotella sp.]MCM1354507.1 insulinase family protein [Bacteroides sp.]MCM1443310.1 insulinase family protein [Muribaculum sp.]MCM1482434.1 insulinase family protein [Paludibacter sp.]
MQTKTKKISDTPTFYHTLPNGIRIVHRFTASPVAWLGLMVGVGTRDEDPKENGMAHFVEHTVFKGTTTRSAKQIINRIENVGGELNAYTTKEETVFYAATLAEYYPRALELIADMLFRPSFPAEELRKERLVIYDEIQSYNDSPSELIYDDFENLLFRGHALQYPVLGEPRTLRWLTASKVRRFMQYAYNTDKMVFFSLSSLPFAQIVRLAERYLGDIPCNTRSFRRMAPAFYTPAQEEFHKHTHQTHVMLGARAYPLEHPRRQALYFLNNIVGGGGMNSLLNLSLREQRGLVYSIESNYTPLSDTGYWAVCFASEPQNAEQCLALVYKQLENLMNKPLSDAAFCKYRKQLLGQMAIGAENIENNALSMAKYMLYYNNAPDWRDIYQQIATLTPHDLFEVANECYNLSSLSLLQYR